MTGNMLGYKKKAGGEKLRATRILPGGFSGTHILEE